jgi:hypothetical protein
MAILRTHLVAFVLAGLIGQAVLASELPIVHGEPVRHAEKRVDAPLALVFPGLPESPDAAVLLRPIGSEKQLLLQQENAGGADQTKMLQVGVARNALNDAVPAPAFRLQWTALADGGRVTRFSLQSPGARALRLGLAVDILPDEAELRVQGAQDPRKAITLVAGREMREAASQQGVYWTPVTEGDRQLAELYLPPGVANRPVRLRIESASHLLTSASEKFSMSAGTGDAQACEQDVACIANPTPAFLDASRSVARLLFTRNGATFLCTGTLINSAVPGNQVPYLHTASHCINSQAVARTLNTFWFFEATYCGSKAPGNYRQLSGGATLLYGNADSDGALLRLNDRAPDGAYFSGWDPNTVEPGVFDITLHHPQGDLKKVSSGQVLEIAGGTDGGSGYITVAWIAGSTEPGSSGAGLFTLREGEYLLRGGLRGGGASCSNTGKPADPSNRDYFSRFDVDYGNFGALLAAAAAPMNDFTDLWWNADESGWGLSITQHADNRIFVLWATHGPDGRALWLSMPDAKWSGVAEVRGTLYESSGPGYSQPFDAARVGFNVVGEATLAFRDADNGTFAYLVDGVRGSKPITRLRF